MDIAAKSTEEIFFEKQLSWFLVIWPYLLILDDRNFRIVIHSPALAFVKHVYRGKW